LPVTWPERNPDFFGSFIPVVFFNLVFFGDYVEIGDLPVVWIVAEGHPLSVKRENYPEDLGVNLMGVQRQEIPRGPSRLNPVHER
jgi:hypothetical protein